MWFYSQRTGIIRHDDEIVTCGYAGNDSGGQCKNNPDAQNVKDHGPLPRGRYTMGVPVWQHPDVGHYAIPLIPHADNEMWGRGGFFWHGDNPNHMGQSSDGCIISTLDSRMRGWSSGDHELTVTE